MKGAICDDHASAKTLFRAVVPRLDCNLYKSTRQLYSAFSNKLTRQTDFFLKELSHDKFSYMPIVRCANFTTFFIGHRHKTTVIWTPDMFELL